MTIKRINKKATETTSATKGSVLSGAVKPEAKPSKVDATTLAKASGAVGSSMATPPGVAASESAKKGVRKVKKGTEESTPTTPPATTGKVPTIPRAIDGADVSDPPTSEGAFTFSPGFGEKVLMVHLNPPATVGGAYGVGTSEGIVNYASNGFLRVAFPDGSESDLFKVSDGYAFPSDKKGKEQADKRVEQRARTENAYAAWVAMFSAVERGISFASTADAFAERWATLDKRARHDVATLCGLKGRDAWSADLATVSPLAVARGATPDGETERAKAREAVKAFFGQYPNGVGGLLGWTDEERKAWSDIPPVAKPSTVKPVKKVKPSAKPVEEPAKKGKVKPTKKAA